MNKKREISISQFKNTFPDVPEMYFKSLEDNILHKTIERAALKEKLISYLHVKPENFGILSTPENYFDELASTVETRLSENTSVSTIWKQLKNEELYEIPENYFNGLSDRIRERVTVQKQRQWEWTPYLLKQPAYIMAAAVCIIAIGFGYFKLTENDTLATQNWTATIETLSKQEITNYIAANASEDLDIQHLSENDWEADLSKTTLEDADANNLILTDEL